RLDMAAGDMAEQRAVGGGQGRQKRRLVAPVRGGKAAGEQPDRGRFHVALAPGNLSREAQPRHRLEPQRGIEKFGRIKEGVAMQTAEPGELGVGEPWNAAEDA